jgi:hypothetical protein
MNTSEKGCEWGQANCWPSQVLSVRDRPFVFDGPANHCWFVYSASSVTAFDDPPICLFGFITLGSLLLVCVWIGSPFSPDKSR